MSEPHKMAHWIIYCDPDASPQAPWFVEHRDDGKTPHWMDDHEYGSFKTYREAKDAMLGWSARECVVLGDE